MSWLQRALGWINELSWIDKALIVVGVVCAAIALTFGVGVLVAIILVIGIAMLGYSFYLHRRARPGGYDDVASASWFAIGIAFVLFGLLLGLVFLLFRFWTYG